MQKYKIKKDVTENTRLKYRLQDNLLREANVRVVHEILATACINLALVPPSGEASKRTVSR